jgi:hypothetical protein
VPIDLDDNLVNAAIVEFHSAKDHGRSDPQAWAAAVQRIRYDVLSMAAVTCEQMAQMIISREDDESEVGAAAAHACAVAIRDFL